MKFYNATLSKPMISFYYWYQVIDKENKKNTCKTQIRIGNLVNANGENIKKNML